MDSVMSQIEEWVYDSTSDKRKSFTIKSNSLKKAIQRKVNKLYYGTGVYFQYSKNTHTAEA